MNKLKAWYRLNEERVQLLAIGFTFGWVMSGVMVLVTVYLKTHK